MIIHTNPFEVTCAARNVAVTESLESLTAVLRRVLEALDRQRVVVMRIRERGEAKSGSRAALDAMLNEIDAIVDSCRVNNVKFLDGRYSRMNCYASMWFRTGPGMHQRERLYIQTMTSRGLGLRVSSGWGDASGGYALQRLDKTRADIRAYISRLGFVSRFVPDPVATELAAHTIGRDIKRYQLGMLECADGNLETVAAVLARIRELARSAANTESSSEKQYCQVEVSALVDEIDRIASQASYNRYKFLLGNFSRVNCYASMWFMNSLNARGISRVYIQTMTAMGLGLKERTGRYTVVVSAIASSPDRDRIIGCVDGALRKVRTERDRLRAYITSFTRSARFNREISVTRGS